MKKSMKMPVGALSVLLAMNCMAAPAFAAEGGLPIPPSSSPESTPAGAVDVVKPSHEEAEMNPVKDVYPVGPYSFYKVNDDNSIVYTDSDMEGYTAVPSFYVSGSNSNKGNVEYGAYVVGEGENKEIIFVPLFQCKSGSDGKYEYEHGTIDGATVSDEVDVADNNDNTLSTQFFVNIKNGIKSPDIGIEKEEHAQSANENVQYKINVATKRSFQLKTTVPMYVCMYGYRGTGDIVTPDASAYQLKNYSTVNEAADAGIVDITKITKFTQIIDEDKSNDLIYSIGYDSNTNKYTYYYTNPADEPDWETTKPAHYIVVEDLKINGSGECYVFFYQDKSGNDTFLFKTAGALKNGEMHETVSEIDPNFPLTNDFIFTNEDNTSWNFGSDVKVGMSQKATNGAVTKGLPVKVTELRSTPATWTLVPTDTSYGGYRPGEISMSIGPEKAQFDASMIDLFDCSAPMDITANGWLIDAPVLDENATVKTPATLGILTHARMAGGNVNTAGCTPVVKVTYTITPLINAEESAPSIGGGTIDTNYGGNATNLDEQSSYD